MKIFTGCTGAAAPILRDNVDTDMLIRIERLAQLKKGEFGPWLFEMLRYSDDGEIEPSFILNQKPFDSAKILIAGRNFGCGSSREMAVWAIEEFGIECVIAESFGDIFFNNCFQNGILAIVLDKETIKKLADIALGGVDVTVDLTTRLITAKGVQSIRFDVPEVYAQLLLSGKDSVEQTLEIINKVKFFQEKDRLNRPWLVMDTID